MNILRFLIPKSLVACLDGQSSLRNGLEKMRNRGYTAMPVISKNGVYLGTVTEGDFLWFLLDHKDCEIKSLEKFCVSDVMRPNWNPPAKASETIYEVFAKLKDQNFVPVVDDRDVFVGIVTRRAVLDHCEIVSNEKKPNPLHNFQTIVLLF